MHLHITGGEWLNQQICRKYAPEGLVLPFNEAMMSGAVCAPVLSPRFCRLRAAALNVPEADYLQKLQPVRNALEALSPADTVTLWFGADTFCQMNRLTVLAALEERGFCGAVESVTVRDEDGEVVSGPAKTALGEYRTLYAEVLMAHRFAETADSWLSAVLPRYFDFLRPDGALARFAAEHPEMEEDALVCALLERSAADGLSDTMARDMIRRVRSPLLVRFYDDAPDERLKFAVIVAVEHGRMLWCRHRERDTWEIPGGHREPGEAVLDTAARELREETAAEEFQLRPLCCYSVTGKTRVNPDGRESFGLLATAEVTRRGDALHEEIAEVRPMDRMPSALTYPDIQPDLMAEALRRGAL